MFSLVKLERANCISIFGVVSLRSNKVLNLFRDLETICVGKLHTLIELHVRAI